MEILPFELSLEIPTFRKIHSKKDIVNPFRSIPCSILNDDFYTSLIDWSKNIIFFVENNTIVTHNFLSTNQMIIYKNNNSICSIRNIKQNNTVVIGDSIGNLIFIDLNTLKYEIKRSHEKRISTLQVINNNILTGSGDKTCKLIDFRTKKPVKIFKNHLLEVCGLSVNREEKLISTGGNDNKIAIIDIRKEEKPLLELFNHKAAIRALSWSPLHSNKLISGGGAADKTIKSWDISLKDPLVKSINFDSQICNLKWLKNDKIISSFGYSDDDIKLLNNFKIEKKYNGHKNRVIHMGVNDTEDFFASGSSDLDIKIFEIDKSVYEDIKVR